VTAPNGEEVHMREGDLATDVPCCVLGQWPRKALEAASSIAASADLTRLME
jgi:hypothetical protein